MDIGILNVRFFIVYKFGCFVIDLIVFRCRYVFVIIFLVEKILFNKNLVRNVFRNFFYYDVNNRILYIRVVRLDIVGDFIVVFIYFLVYIKVGTLFLFRLFNGLKFVNLSVKNLGKKRCLN